jgi:starch phosphorylase
MQDGMHCVIPLQLPDRLLHVAVWRLAAGRVPLYLMDTNLEVNAPGTGNCRPASQGDQEMRLRQEIALGIGACGFCGSLRSPRRFGTPTRAHRLHDVERVREQVEAGLSLSRRWRRCAPQRFYHPYPGASGPTCPLRSD